MMYKCKLNLKTILYLKNTLVKIDEIYNFNEVFS